MGKQPQSQEKIERTVTEFTASLRMLFPHPKPRYHILKHYVNTLVKALAKLETLDHHSLSYQKKLQKLPKKLPGEEALLPWVGPGQGMGRATHLLEGFKQFCQTHAESTGSPLTWYNTLALFLQVEVVKASRELEASGEDDLHFIRQGEQLVEGDATGSDDDVEHISQEYDIVEALADKTQNAAEALTWVKMLQAANPLPKKEQGPASAEKKETASASKEPKPEHTPTAPKEDTPGTGRGF